jgi:hypothetical protein
MENKKIKKEKNEIINTQNILLQKKNESFEYENEESYSDEIDCSFLEEINSFIKNILIGIYNNNIYKIDNYYNNKKIENVNLIKLLFFSLNVYVYQ